MVFNRERALRMAHDYLGGDVLAGRALADYMEDYAETVFFYGGLRELREFRPDQGGWYWRYTNELAGVVRGEFPVRLPSAPVWVYAERAWRKALVVELMSWGEYLKEGPLLCKAVADYYEPEVGNG